MIRPAHLAMSLFLLAILGAPAEAARRGAERGPAPATTELSAQSDRRLSLDEAVARAERRHGARAVKAESKRRGDRLVYRIRLLGADGRVFEVSVDAETGEER